MKLHISYNPYLLESKFYVNEKEETKAQWVKDIKKTRLQTWFYAGSNWKGLCEELDGALNSKAVTITFTGREIDFTDLKLSFDGYNTGNHKTQFTVIKPQTFGKNDKQIMAGLDKIVDSFAESNIPELQTDTIKAAYQAARNAEFEMAVVATMSSGKSTLINALLGRDLLPAANRATTAKITRIKDNDNAEKFMVECIGEDETTVVHEKCEASPELLAQYNQDNKVFYIDMEGDIPEISGSNMRLKILDTPGPNNSATNEHRMVTNSVLHDQERKPIIMYVMNATQLKVDADAVLLREIADEMKKGGKQAQERFVFVMNKADELDPENGEDLQQTVTDCQDYLKTFDIVSNQIIPISARAAKLLRMKASNLPITAKDTAWLPSALCNMQLDAAAKLTPSCRKELEEQKQRANAGKDEHTLALIATGIVGLELTINEYLEKYAYPYKINQAVETFLKEINEKEMTENFKKKISASTDMRDAAQKALERAQQKKEELDKGGMEIKEKVEKIEIDDKIFRNAELDLEKNIGADFATLRAKEEIPMSEKNIFLDDVKRSRAKVIQNAKTKLQKSANAKLHKDFDPIYNDYRNVLREFKEKAEIPGLDMDLFVEMQNAESALLVVQEDDIDKILRRGNYVHAKTHEEIRWKSNPERSGFWGFFKFWEPREISYQVTVDEGEFIKSAEILGEVTAHAKGEFRAEIKKVEKFMRKIYKEKCKDCNILVKDLGCAVNSVLDEIKQNIQEVENQKMDIQANQEKCEWIQKAKQHLENLTRI